MITKEKMNEIAKIAIGIDHDDAFAGKSKGNRHLYRVVDVAEYLAKKVSADVDIAKAGAWLHDTALPTGDDYNYGNNKKVILKILDNIGLDNNVKENIAECVASHEGTEKAKTLEAEVVHDADVLEKNGILGIIRHTWKLTNFGKIDYRNVTDENVKEVLDHIKWRKSVLKTDEAKKIAEMFTVDIDFEKAKKIITTASAMAFDGIITENIAVEIEKFLNEDEIKLLKSQLDLRYLK